MAKIPTYDGLTSGTSGINLPNVNTDAVPGVAGVEAQNFGSQLVKAGTQLTDTIAKIETVRRQKADAITIDAATNAFNTGSFEALQKFRQLKGRDALGMTAQYYEQMQEQLNDIVQAADPRLQGVIKNNLEALTLQSASNLSNREYEEQQVYEQGVREDGIKNLMNSAMNVDFVANATVGKVDGEYKQAGKDYVGVPGSVFDDIEEIEQRIDENGDQLGLSAETIRNQKDTAKNQIWGALIDRMITEHPEIAMEFFEKFEDNITDVTVRKSLRETAKTAMDNRYVVSTTQAKVDEWSTELGADAPHADVLLHLQNKRSELMKEENAIDPVRAEKVMAAYDLRVTQVVNEMKASVLQAQTQLFDAIDEQGRGNASLATLKEQQRTINYLSRNDPAAWKAVQDYVVYRNTPGKVYTDLNVWSDLNELRINDPQAFVQEDLRKYIGVIDETDLQRLGESQADLNDPQNYLTTSNETAAINAVIRTFGWKSSKKSEQKRIGQFTLAAMNAIQDYKTENKKKRLSVDEVNDIVTRLTLDETWVDMDTPILDFVDDVTGGASKDITDRLRETDRKGFQGSPGENFEKKNMIPETLDDIPPADYDELMKLRDNSGRAFSDEFKFWLWKKQKGMDVGPAPERYDD